MCILENPNPKQISKEDFKGRTLSNFATGPGHFAIVEFLMSLLEDKNPSDDNLITPLHLAAHTGQNNIVDKDGAI